jgi:hypothetical protein
MIVHFLLRTNSMRWYVLVCLSTNFMVTCWILHLKFRPAESADFADSAGRNTNACTNRFIHLTPLPGALGPFPDGAAADFAKDPPPAAARGGSGAAAGTSATAVKGTRSPGLSTKNRTQSRMWQERGQSQSRWLEPRLQALRQNSIL